MTGRRAVVFDFGGVLTSSVLAAFEEFGATLGDPTIVLRTMSQDPDGAALLVAHEEGRIGEREFEVGFAERLRVAGADVSADGLVTAMMAALRPDAATLDLVARLRAEGRRVGLLSNHFGDDCYAGFDLDSLFDSVTLSSGIGVRKPSRRAFRAACDALGVRLEEAVMVDDLQMNIDGAARIGMAGVVHTDAETTERELRELLEPLADQEETG